MGPFSWKTVNAKTGSTSPALPYSHFFITNICIECSRTPPSLLVVGKGSSTSLILTMGLQMYILIYTSVSVSNGKSPKCHWLIAELNINARNVPHYVSIIILLKQSMLRPANLENQSDPIDLRKTGMTPLKASAWRLEDNWQLTELALILFNTHVVFVEWTWPGLLSRCLHRLFHPGLLLTRDSPRKHGINCLTVSYTDNTITGDVASTQYIVFGSLYWSPNIDNVH